jgi:hypothetical protein
MIAIPGQANVLNLPAVAVADGSPIVAGTVNFYLYCLTGTNAGKWWRGADTSWQAAEALALAGTLIPGSASGHWTASVASGAWDEGVAYVAYLKESGDLHIPVSENVLCTAQLDAAAVRTAVGLASANLDTQLGTVAKTGADSDTLETLSDQIDGIPTVGSGPTGIPYTLTDADTGLPIADATVWATSDVAGNNIIGSGRTNAAGVVTLYPDLATGTAIYIWRHKTGANFINPDTEEMP